MLSWLNSWYDCCVSVSLMSRLGILVGSLRSLLWSSPDRPAVSLVLTAMLRQAHLPYWSGRGSDSTVQYNTVQYSTGRGSDGARRGGIWATLCDYQVRLRARYQGVILSLRLSLVRGQTRGQGRPVGPQPLQLGGEGESCSQSYHCEPAGWWSQLSRPQETLGFIHFYGIHPTTR